MQQLYTDIIDQLFVLLTSFIKTLVKISLDSQSYNALLLKEMVMHLLSYLILFCLDMMTHSSIDI